jgi:hypothetical protein
MRDGAAAPTMCQVRGGLDVVAGHSHRDTDPRAGQRVVLAGSTTRRCGSVIRRLGSVKSGTIIDVLTGRRAMRTSAAGGERAGDCLRPVSRFHPDMASEQNASDASQGWRVSGPSSLREPTRQHIGAGTQIRAMGYSD